jgi:transposase
MKFLQKLRAWIARNGSENIVYMDESGFTAKSYRPHGWARRGEKVYGLISGNNRKTTNLIMAQRGKEWLAPMLFQKSCTHETVLAWLEQALLKELRPNSLIVMDNAPFHNKPKIKALLEKHGHTLLPLPKYSPDYNPIEQAFAILKKRLRFSGQTLDNQLSRSYLE